MPRRSVPARPRRSQDCFRPAAGRAPNRCIAGPATSRTLEPGVNVADGVIEIDTLLGGWHRVTAGYLIEGSAPLLVETGSQSSVPVLLDQLDRLGLAAEDLAGRGGHPHPSRPCRRGGRRGSGLPEGDRLRAREGARHLVDPTRLVDSAARVYGPLLDSLYGRLDPTPKERIHVLEDGEEIPVSPTRSLVAVDSPGHAKHHVALHDTLSGVLFAGDAVGVKLPDGGVLRPSTPPPDFDLDLALHSLNRFTERRPTSLALAHYGLLDDPLEILEQADGTLRRWAEVAEAAFRNGRRHRGGARHRVRRPTWTAWLPSTVRSSR